VAEVGDEYGYGVEEEIVTVLPSVVSLKVVDQYPNKRELDSVTFLNTVPPKPAAPNFLLRSELVGILDLKHTRMYFSPTPKIPLLPIILLSQYRILVRKGQQVAKLTSGFENQQEGQECRHHQLVTV
jgi:hypothetical protein